MFRPLLLSVLILAEGVAFAKDPPDPCRTRSREMTLVKNCYSGDMVKSSDAATQFFNSVDLPSNNKVSYCFNSLITVEHKANDFHFHILKDSKDGKFHAYEYVISQNELKKIKNPLVGLNGLKGTCYSKTGDREVCNGGILKAIGWKDVDAPLVLAMAKTKNGHYTVSSLFATDNEEESQKVKPIDGNVILNNKKVTDQLLQEIRKKIVGTARSKMSVVHSGATTPKRMADQSEQFRYCTLAFEGYLKFQKLNDPLSPDEKMTLATLTSYMNDDAKVTASAGRMPASVPSKKKRGH